MLAAGYIPDACGGRFLAKVHVVLRNIMDVDYGISLDPSAVSQRHTLYDSDEEDESECVNSPFSIDTAAPTSELTQAGPLIVTVGQPASIFVKSHFCLQALTSGNPALFQTSDPNAFKDQYFPAKPCNPSVVTEVYSAQSESGGASETQICVHNRSLKSHNVNVWSTKLLEVIKPSCVLVLLSLTTYDHHSSHSLSVQPCFLRTITTSSWTHPPFDGTTPLEPPNVISGEAAAVLTWCQVHSIPAALVVMYASSSASMSERVTGFLPLLKHSVIDECNLAQISSSEALKIVKALEPKPRRDLSSLYV